MKNKENPKISFVTPCYNDCKEIARMIDSVLGQDYKNIEQIVVDDGSTDDSRKILKKMEKKHKNLRVIYLKENRGACIARNIGAKFATGKYISFLPADAMLYPGMARIWVESLEERPECDFLYGGYRITDEEYRPLQDYMGDEFDPYFMEVTNYIDGSYPLKKELYDKLAKKNTEHYGKETGAWDPNIKSLQDWDFWLNAIKWCDAKGFYMPDVFFETVRPHPGGLSFDSHNNWIERTTTIKEKYGIPRRRICVTSQGARFHAKNVAKMLNADFLDVPSFKPHNYDMIYLVGFFGNVSQAFQKFDGIRVVHWIGSDVWSILQQQKQETLRLPDGKQVKGADFVKFQIEWIKNNVDVNLTEFGGTQKELESLGIKSQILPLPPKQFYDAKPFPKKFTIGVYDPYQNKEFYMPDLVKGVAEKMKEVQWKFFGDPTTIGKKGNIEHCGRITDMQKLINDCSCILRLTPHDGLPISVIEFESAKRNVITNVKGVKHAEIIEPKEKNIIKAIKRTLKKGLNEQGCKYYRELCDHKKFKDFILNLLKYDAKEYWNRRAEVWNKVEGFDKDAQEEYIIKNEIEKSGAKSVIDIGCGNGKWADILSDGREYLGIDISEKLLKFAKEKYPKLKFQVGDVRNLDNVGMFDVGFCYTTLLHLTPDEIKDGIEQLRKVCKKLIIIEPINKLNQNDIRPGIDRVMNPIAIEEQQKGNYLMGIRSSFIHDYVKLLNITKQINLGPRTLMICEL